MNFFRDIFQYEFLSNALIACVLSGVLCGIVGTYVVTRRIVFLTGGITHSSFGGIGIAYHFGYNPILGALIFAILSAVGIEWSSERGRIREDSAIGIMWSIGMALGVIFIAMTPGYAPNLMSFLFGNILTVTKTDITFLFALAAFMALIFSLFWRQIMYVAFDKEYAATQGMPVKFISYLMSILVSLTIVLSIRSVGIVLLISLLTIPTVIVNSFTRSYKKIIVLSVIVAVFGNIVGLWASYQLEDVPAGATTIIILTITLIFIKLLPLCTKLYRNR